jgi:hypothetical protein
MVQRLYEAQRKKLELQKAALKGPRFTQASITRALSPAPAVVKPIEQARTIPVPIPASSPATAATPATPRSSWLSAVKAAALPIAVEHIVERLLKNSRWSSSTFQLKTLAGVATVMAVTYNSSRQWLTFGLYMTYKVGEMFFNKFQQPSDPSPTVRATHRTVSHRPFVMVPNTDQRDSVDFVD